MSFFGGLAAGAASVASRRDRTGDQATAGGVVVVGPAAATASSAERSDDGSSRPRRSARRRIPAAAFGLKQYLDRCGPVSSTSDKDDATASLGYSEVLSVQHSVGDAIPEFSQRPEDGTHCAAVEFHAPPAGAGGVAAGSSPNRVPCVAVAAAGSFGSAEAGADRRQEARHVFQTEPPRPKVGEEPNDLPEEFRTCATQPEATSRHGEVLAGPAGEKNSVVGIKSGCSELIGSDLPYVGEQGGVWHPVVDDPAGGHVDLDGRGDADPRPREGVIESADTGEEGDGGHLGHAGPPLVRNGMSTSAHACPDLESTIWHMDIRRQVSLNFGA
jgi:hypothetical protein